MSVKRRAAVLDWRASLMSKRRLAIPAVGAVTGVRPNSTAVL